MRIPIVFVDGTPGAVESETLDILLQRRSIQTFRRAGGWVRIGLDAVRTHGGSSNYKGVERRKNSM